MAAEKTFPLSIVIRTVDQATAGLKKINHQLEHMTKPTREFGKQLKELGETSGFDKVIEGFHGVGEQLKETVIRLLEVGVVAGEIVHLLVEKFTNLGVTAKLIGVTATELAELHFAAKQSGVSVEEFDSSMEKLNKSLGEMKAGGGKLKSFLQTVSPALLKQVQGAKSNVEVLKLLSNAMKKLEDPTKRAALATAAFGRGGQPLINMLAEGADNIDELMKEYFKLAGAQDDAAESAHELHQAQGRIAAVFDGIEAAIVTAVAPALLELGENIKKFFVEHREEILAFIKDFGEKLPARIEAVGAAFRAAINFVKPFWDAIGGLGGAVKILAALMVGKLIVSIVSLGVVLLTTPFGWVLAGIAALVAGATLLIANWDKVSAFFSDLWLGIKQTFKDALDFIQPIIDAVVGGVGKIKDAWSFFTDENILNPPEPGAGFTKVGRGVSLPSIAPIGPRAGTETRVKVDFTNAPKGTRVTTDPKSTAEVDLSVGYGMSMP